MRHHQLATLSCAGALFLAGCGGTPDAPTVTDERSLDVDVESATVVSTSLGAQAVYWSDDRVELDVDTPWAAQHRFDHPIFERVADACADSRPADAWTVSSARLMDNGETVATLVDPDDDPVVWSDLAEMALPEHTQGSERLAVTLHFSGDAAPVEGDSRWRVRAGGAGASLHRDLEARVTGISSEPGRAMIDGELTATRYLDVEIRNTGNNRYTLDAHRSGAGLDNELLSMASDQAGTIAAGSRTVVQVPLRLPGEIEGRLQSEASLDRVPVDDIRSWQWQDTGTPLAQHRADAVERIQGSAYIVARDQDGHERTGFVDATIVVDRLDRIHGVKCAVGGVQ